MQPEGMVHALEEIHRLLRPHGAVLEIHPVHGAWVEVRSGLEVMFVEADPGFDSDDDLRATDQAVATVVDRGLFAIDGAREFDFVTYAPSVRELRDHFALVGGYSAGPGASVVPLRDAMYRRAEDAIERSVGRALLLYREQAKASRMIPVAPPTDPEPNADGQPDRPRRDRL